MEGADRSPGDIARSARKRVTVVRKLTFAATVDLERPAGADNAKIKDKADLIFDELYDLWEPYSNRTTNAVLQSATRHVCSSKHPSEIYPC